jgi:hypothetical protein
MHFFPIFNKTPLKFPTPWVWVMFPKSWKKSLQLKICLFPAETFTIPLVVDFDYIRLNIF